MENWSKDKDQYSSLKQPSLCFDWKFANVSEVEENWLVLISSCFKEYFRRIDEWLFVA